jgi:hypothetical protein
MPKTPGQASYLQRRGPIWYFRFRLPSQIQSVAEQTEIAVATHCLLNMTRDVIYWINANLLDT